MTRRNRTAAAAAALMFALGLSAPARAQTFLGRIDVTVQDPAGAPLTGAKVDISGGQDDSRTSDTEGRAHFLNLPVAVYSVSVSLSGFTTSINRNIGVMSGMSTGVILRLTAAPAAGAAASEAAAASVPPVIERRRDTTTEYISAEEIANTPNARDVWALLQGVPTVFVDRVNVGGSSSGLQANYGAKGAQPTDNTWSLDGVPITDMGDGTTRPAAVTGVAPLVTGSSSFYYDIDSFEDIAVTTGGADAQNGTAGVGINLLLKTGMNNPAGEGHLFFENQTLQSVNIPAALATALDNTSGLGARMDRYFDKGFDVGGPIFRDQLWVWGTAAWNTVNRVTLAGDPDDTGLTTYALKFDGVANKNVRGNFTFYHNNNEQDGRGASALRPAETAWNQSGPATYYKGEGRFILGSRFFATTKVAIIHDDFDLAPVGGMAADYHFDAGLVAHGSFYEYTSTRPQRYVGGDGNYLVGPNEIKFGGAWRSTPVNTQQIFPASHLVATWESYPNMLVQAARDYQALTAATYIDAFATDTISLNRLTLTAGVRYDHQTSSLGAASVPGVAGIAVLPALTAPAVNNVFNWSNLTPRAGVTIALDESRKTIVRASYAKFAAQLPGTEASFVSPIQHAYAYYNAVDRNGDGNSQLSEVLLNQGLQGYTGFDPNNPGRLTSVNTVDPNVKAPTTQELLAGVDRELMPHFSVGATVTYRRMNDLLWDPLTGVTSANYAQTGVLSGVLPEIGAYSVPLYALNASAVPAGGGETETNRPGYHQQYVGFEVSATKRLSSRWMARVAFSHNSWREYFDDPSKAILDPTRAPAPSLARPFAGPQVAGGTALQPSIGSGQSSIFMTAPTYQFLVNGMYQAFWGVSISGNLTMRQGYAEPFYESNVQTGDPLGPKTVLLTPTVDAFRLPAVTTLDGRAEKRFHFGGTMLAVDFDVFNLLNSATVLGKQYDARATGATGFDQTLEIMSPRIARIGVRFTF